jgi:glucosyl-dolichyl phosphate glucuronosyltransferase
MKHITPTISVIICTCTQDRWYHLLAAVDSVQQQTLRPIEVIVVVDHNKFLLEQVQKNIPGILVIENKELPGLSGARNSGIAAAQGELIAFLDDDAIAEENWLSWLSCCCADPLVLGVGGRVEPSWSVKRPGWLPEEFYWVIGCSYRGLPEVRAIVRNPYGGCTCYRRDVFEVVGGFKNDIGHIGSRPLGGEETELCIRAKHHWPQKFFLYEPQARIYHFVSKSRTSLHYFCSRCYAEGLSKAVISRYVGAKDTLTSEYSYTLRILPTAILRGLMDVFSHFDLTALLRAGVIIVGLAITIVGYLTGSVLQPGTPVKKAMVAPGLLDEEEENMFMS